MRETIKVVNAVINNGELLFEVDHLMDINDLQANGQMLVDSDNTSFIYLAEKNNEYTYIMFHSELWSRIKEGLDQQCSAFLTNENSRLLLTNFHEEITYLIDNIKGNSNYGEEMVKKVEDTF